MSEEEKNQIIEHFAASFRGRFGALKPTWAMANCAAYIAELRAAHLSWKELELLFNAALAQEGLKTLATGSVARLYHRAPKADAPPSAVRRPVRKPEPPLHHSTIQTALVELSSESARARQIDPEPAHAGDEAEVMVDRLGRIRKRAQDKKRFDEA